MCRGGYPGGGLLGCALFFLRLQAVTDCASRPRARTASQHFPNHRTSYLLHLLLRVMEGSVAILTGRGLCPC